MNNKVLSLISICKKAGRLSTGEFTCENSIKSGYAKLVILAEDSSDNTKKKFENQCSYYNIKLITSGSKQELGKTVGQNERAVITINDEGFSKKIISLMEIQ